MAEDGDTGSSSGEIAARLGRGPASFGPIRANLIAKGLFYALEHGVIAFTPEWQPSSNASPNKICAWQMVGPRRTKPILDRGNECIGVNVSVSSE